MISVVEFMLSLKAQVSSRLALRTKFYIF